MWRESGESHSASHATRVHLVALAMLLASCSGGREAAPASAPTAEATATAPAPSGAVMQGDAPRPGPSVAGITATPTDASLAPATGAPPRVPPSELVADPTSFEEREEAMRPPEPAWAWGATTWLSNDDSMSLASAQRVLWAVANDVPFSAGQVRPHELLNYFSFESAPVRGGDMFSVQGTAQATGSDTLTLALVVRGATPPRQPMDLTLVVDRSGSMKAEGRMEYVQRALRLLGEQLQRGDTVDLVAFDDDVDVYLENHVVGRDPAAAWLKAVDRLKPRGSTDLAAGLRKAYALAIARSAAGPSGRNRRVMVLTDALLNTGDVNEDLVSEVGRAWEEHGIRLTGVGVGREFNDRMLDKLTEKGKGAYVYLGSEAVVDRLFGAGFDSLTQTVAHDVRFALDLPDSLAMERFYGEESSTNPEDVQPIHYYAGTTQVFLQDLRIRPGAALRADEIRLAISFEDAATGRAREQTWSGRVEDLLEARPHTLLKARALMAWSDVLLAQAMRNDPCGAPLATFQDRITHLRDDAEVAYVSKLTSHLCPDAPALTAEAVRFRVRVDADIPIAEVAAACGGTHHTERLVPGENVAELRLPPGTCQLEIQGAVPMTARVDVPRTGGQVRCVVRAGRLTCT